MKNARTPSSVMDKLPPLKLGQHPPDFGPGQLCGRQPLLTWLWSLLLHFYFRPIHSSVGAWARTQTRSYTKGADAVWYCRQHLSTIFFSLVAIKSQKMPNYTNTWSHQTSVIMCKKLKKMPNHKRDMTKRWTPDDVHDFEMVEIFEMRVFGADCYQMNLERQTKHVRHSSGCLAQRRSPPPNFLFISTVQKTM